MPITMDDLCKIDTVDDLKKEYVAIYNAFESAIKVFRECRKNASSNDYFGIGIEALEELETADDRLKIFGGKIANLDYLSSARQELRSEDVDV